MTDPTIGMIDANDVEFLHQLEERSPVPVPSPQGPNMMHIHVPSESTDVMFGAADDSLGPAGIRMQTATHAHITAGSPATTIALGGTGESSGEGGAGLRLYTAGAKYEHVALGTTELYDLTKTETVVGPYVQTVIESVTENYLATKTETVTETVTETYKAEHVWNVTGAAEHHYHDELTQTVANNLSSTIGGVKEETIKGKAFLTWEGPTLEKFLDLRGTIHLGSVNEAWVGQRSDMTIGNHTDVRLAFVQELKLAGKLAAKLGPHIELENLHLHKNTLTLEAVDAKLEEAEAKLSTLEAELKNASATVYSTEVHVHNTAIMVVMG